MSPEAMWRYNQLIDRAKDVDIGTVSMKTFMSPSYTLEEKLRRVDEDADAKPRLQPFLDQGYSFAEALIMWSLGNPDVHSRLIGMRTAAEVDENALAVASTITRPPAAPSDLKVT
jgi:aryl-alcohol dehydrogenase-like predicted oxidoreductase